MEAQVQGCRRAHRKGEGLGCKWIRRIEIISLRSETDIDANLHRVSISPLAAAQVKGQYILAWRDRDWNAQQCSGSTRASVQIDIQTIARIKIKKAISDQIYRAS